MPAAVDAATVGLDWIAGPLAFLVTDIDDLFVLVAFFADPAVRPRDVVTGQFTGIAALLAASALAMLVRLVVPDHAIGLLGLAPLALGIGAAVDLVRSGRKPSTESVSAEGEVRRPSEAAAARRSGIVGVALVTIANGGDNVAVYAPLFASSGPLRAVGLAVIFLAMTGLWLALAWFTVRNPLFGGYLRRWGRYLLPPVLVLLGAAILWENGTLAWLAGLVGG